MEASKFDEIVQFVSARSGQTEEQTRIMFGAGYTYTVSLNTQEEGWRI